MATTPRAGIINLNFKDVSQMAQNIADNDPWKLGIETAGKILTDREKHILYQRALADAQKKDRPEDKTAGELIGAGIGKAGDAFSWLGEKAGNGIDKLRALLPSDTIEKSYEEGEMTEDGINVTFPTTVVGKDKEIERPRREVGEKTESPIFQGEMSKEDADPFAGGMSREQTMSKLQAPESVMGTRVTFPTTLGSPATKETAPETAPIAGAEVAQESDSPIGATEVKPQKIKAPRMTEMEAWSEMNRLDPQRAKFDYDRVQNQKKVDIETMKALGKDANIDDIRAMHNAYMNNLTALYNQGANDDDLRVIEAKAAIEYTAGLLAEKGLLPKSGESSTQKKTQEELEAEKKIGKETKDRAYEILDTAIGDECELPISTPCNQELLTLAAKHQPPQHWYEETDNPHAQVYCPSCCGTHRSDESCGCER